MLVNNNSIGFNTTHTKHFNIDGNTQSKSQTDPTSSFVQALNDAFSKVNTLEVKSEELQKQMVTDPESVNLHEVTIAQTEAELALSFTKSISSRVITAFNELTNLR